MFTHSLQYAAGAAAAAAVAAGATYFMTRNFSTEAQLGRLLMAFTEQLKAEQAARQITCFSIDRILDADCKGRTLAIGVHSKGDPALPLSNQGLRHGDGQPIRRLLKFERSPDGKALHYTFEEGARLSIIPNKTQKGEVVYSLDLPVPPYTVIAKTIDPIVLRNFKPIGMNSAELDAIAELR